MYCLIIDQMLSQMLFIITKFSEIERYNPVLQTRIFKDLDNCEVDQVYR